MDKSWRVVCQLVCQFPFAPELGELERYIH